MAYNDVVRWLFVGTKETPVASYIDSFGNGQPVFTTSVDDASIQVILDQNIIDKNASLNGLMEHLNTHFTDIIVIVVDSSSSQMLQLTESLLGMKNLPQSTILCDTNPGDEYCTALSDIAEKYSSAGYSFHYISIPGKGADVLNKCLLRATKYCLRRRAIMLARCPISDSLEKDRDYGDQAPISDNAAMPNQAETSSPLVSLSPQAPQPVNSRRLQGDAIDSTPDIPYSKQPLLDCDIAPQKVPEKPVVLNSKLASLYSGAAQNSTEPTNSSPTSFNFTLDIGAGKEALFHGYIGQDPGSAVLEFMKIHSVSSRDYVMLYNKVKQLMIDNGYLTADNEQQQSPRNTPSSKPRNDEDTDKLVFSTNILFGSKQVKIDFYEGDTPEEAARRTVQNFGLGQSYEVYLAKKINIICNSMKKK